MKLLIVTEVVSDRVANPALYQPFVEELLDFLGNRFETEIIESLSAAGSKIAGSNISALIFLSRAMMIKAMNLGQKFPSIKFLVFCGILENDLQKPYDNVFLIRKDAVGQKGAHFQKMLEILNPGVK